MRRNGIAMGLFMEEIDKAYERYHILKSKRLNDLKERILQFAREEEQEDLLLKAELKAVARGFVFVFPELQRYEEIVVRCASNESQLKAETARFLESLSEEKVGALAEADGQESMIRKVQQRVRQLVPALVA